MYERKEKELFETLHEIFNLVGLPVRLKKIQETCVVIEYKTGGIQQPKTKRYNFYPTVFDFCFRTIEEAVAISMWKALEILTERLIKLNLNKDQLLKILKEKIPEEYDIIQRRHLELMVKIYGTSIIDELLKKSGWHYSKKVLDESTYKKYVNELKQLEDKLRIYRPCVTVYLDICEKLEFCQKLDAHLKLNIALPIKMISNINIKPEEEEFSAFIGIFVKNLKWVVPHSYSDLIRLVDDRRIADFRSYFWSCLEDVREGKLTIDEVERKLRKANEVITSIERTERLSFISWLCLPLSILGYIVPQLSSLSKVISLVSTSINIRNFILKRKYRWAMVGLKL